ncbi:hypothetical protein GCM10008994_17440 [Halorubrum ejinorense]|uniref:Uncharacterized protein n=1 Tax=Halorubrum ejinorense TaxID=425309 RepID=A0AAV3SS74_9EURY
MKQRRLPGAVRADEAEEIALLDRQRDVAHGDRVAVGERHTVEVDNCAHCVCPTWVARTFSSFSPPSPRPPRCRRGAARLAVDAFGAPIT